MAVYRKAQSLMHRHPETIEVVAEMITAYEQAFDNLDEDFAILDRARK